MKKFFKALTAGMLAVCLSACSSQSKVDKEIQLPIYETEVKVKTAAASVMDLEESTKVAAAIGYATADSLSTAVKGNLIAYNAVAYQSYKQGDVIAAIDSSDMDYEYRRQSIYTEAAREEYERLGTERARLEYEYQKALLDEVEYRRDQYVIYAPYDCIVTDASSLTVGEELNKGAYICSVAPEGDIFVYIDYNPDRDKSTPFKLGTKVSITLTGSAYEGTVVSMPKSNAYDHPLRFMSNSSAFDNSANSESNLELLSLGNSQAGIKVGNSAYSASKLGLSAGNYQTQNTIFGNPYGGPTSANSSSNIIIGFEPEVLKKLLEETPNAVKAGWATVHIVTKKYCGVLVLPQNAVTVKDTSYVYLYKDGQRIQTPVTVGDTIGGYTVILAGLHEGDEVAY